MALGKCGKRSRALNISGELCVECVKNFRKSFQGSVGRPKSMQDARTLTLITRFDTHEYLSRRMRAAAVSFFSFV